MFSRKNGITKQMNGGTMYEQREIVLIPFPYSDLTGSKQRPALIVSNENLNKSDDRICCLITSNEPRDSIAITSSAFEKGSLPFKSWVKPHRLFTIDQRIVKKKLGRVSKEFHEKVLKGIVSYLEIQKK